MCVIIMNWHQVSNFQFYKCRIGQWSFQNWKINLFPASTAGKGNLIQINLEACFYSIVDCALNREQLFTTFLSWSPSSWWKINMKNDIFVRGYISKTIDIRYYIGYILHKSCSDLPKEISICECPFQNNEVICGEIRSDSHFFLS